MDNFNLRAYLTNNPLLKEKTIFEKFLDGETEYNTLNEFLLFLNEADEKVIDKAQDAYDDLNQTEKDIADGFAVDTAGNIIPIQDLTRDNFGQELNAYIDKTYGPLAKKIKNKIRGAKLLVGTLATIVLANVLGNTNGKPIPVKDIDDTKAQTTVQMQKNLDSDLKKTLGPDEFKKTAQAIDQNKAFDIDPDGKKVHIQFDTGDSELSDEDKADIETTVTAVANQIKNNKDTEATIKHATGVSNNGDENSNISNKGTNLTQDRYDVIQKALEDEVEKQGLSNKVKVVGTKIDYKKSKETKANNQNKGQGSNIGVDFKSNQQAQKTTKIADLLMNPPAPKNIPTEPEPSPTDTKTPSPTGGEDVAPSTTKVTANQTEKDIQAATGGKLNRNGQIATVLRTLNFDNLNLYKELGIDGVKSFSDSELTKIQDDPNSTDKAKKIAAGVLSIRKNPQTLLDKVGKALNIKLSTRAKAQQVAPGAAGKLSAFAPKLTEIVEETLNEAFVDEFISDNDIRKNKVAILALLGSMYATDSDSGNYLSILDIEKANLTDEEKDQLTKLGFSPQLGGKDYVFLTTKSTSPKTTPISNQPKDPDSDRIAVRISKNPRIKDKLKRINSTDELKDMIVSIADKVASTAVATPRVSIDKINKAITPADRTSTTGNVSYTYKYIKEEVSKDVDDIMDLINQDKSLSTQLKQTINKPLEFTYLLVKAFLPYISPNLSYNSIKMAFQKAKDELSKKQVNEAEIERLKKLAGIKK